MPIWLLVRIRVTATTAVPTEPGAPTLSGRAGLYQDAGPEPAAPGGLRDLVGRARYLVGRARYLVGRARYLVGPARRSAAPSARMGARASGPTPASSALDVGQTERAQYRAHGQLAARRRCPGFMPVGQVEADDL